MRCRSLKPRRRQPIEQAARITAVRSLPLARSCSIWSMVIVLATLLVFLSCGTGRIVYKISLPVGAELVNREVPFRHGAGICLYGHQRDTCSWLQLALNIQRPSCEAA